jgi:hypothetical protein
MAGAKNREYRCWPSRKSPANTYRCGDQPPGRSVGNNGDRADAFLEQELGTAVGEHRKLVAAERPVAEHVDQAELCLHD